MTIGIACYGINSVSAALAAVLGAELAGRGDIGGFSVLAVLDENGVFHSCSAQRGGVSSLVYPSEWKTYKFAALISSGPDRPEPLIQFLPGQSGVGLITGHRIPNTIDVNQRPLNISVLKQIEKGIEPQIAINTALVENPEADAGLIALTASGIAFGNSARVARRSDLGLSSRSDLERGYALLHNSIYANDPTHFSKMIGQLSWNALNNHQEDCGFLQFNNEIALQYADEDRVHINSTGEIIAIETANKALFSGQYSSRTVVYGTPSIFCEHLYIGQGHTELRANVDNGNAFPLERSVDRTMIFRRSNV